MKFPFNSKVIIDNWYVTDMYLKSKEVKSLPEGWLKEDKENLWCIRQQIIAEVYFR